MTEIQIQIRQLRLTLISIGIGAVIGLSLYSAHIILTKPEWFVKEEKTLVVLPSNTSAPSPIAPTIYTGRRPTMRSNHPVTAPVTHSVTHSVTPATSPSAPIYIYRTSNATVHSVSGGTGNGGASPNSTSSSSQRGIHTSTIAYTGMIYVATPHNAVTAVGATQAEEVVNTKMGIVSRRAKREDGWAEENDGPALDAPTPIGDITWGLIVLLAAGYAYHLSRRKRPLTKQTIK